MRTLGLRVGDNLHQFTQLINTRARLKFSQKTGSLYRTKHRDSSSWTKALEEQMSRNCGRGGVCHKSKDAPGRQASALQH